MQVFFQDILCIIIFFANHSYNEEWILFLFVNVVNVWFLIFLRFHISPWILNQNIFLQDILFVWIFPPLALLNIVWKMESFSENENTLIQNEGCEMFMSEVKYKDKVMEEIQQNPSLQTKEKKILKNDEKTLRKIWNYCIPKGKNEGLLIGMPYVGLCSMWMTMQKWHLVYLKSCVNNCVIPILCFPSTQKWN